MPPCASSPARFVLRKINFYLDYLDGFTSEKKKLIKVTNIIFFIIP